MRELDEIGQDTAFLPTALDLLVDAARLLNHSDDPEEMEILASEILGFMSGLMDYGLLLPDQVRRMEQAAMREEQ